MPATNSEQYFRLVAAQTSMIPIFGFAIFYNGQLEFTQTAPLTVRGRTHANGPICLGPSSGSSITFNSSVTTASSIVWSNIGGYTFPPRGSVIYNGSPQTNIGVPTLQLPIGTNNTAVALREIIHLPPPGESSSSPMGQQRYYNKAAIVLLVSNTTVSLIVKNPGDPSGTLNTYFYSNTTPSAVNQSNLNRFLPWVSLTNRFYDYREGKWVMPTQIDMGKLKIWVVTNSLTINKFPGIMYVADFRTLTNLHAVRLTNGIVIPTNAPHWGGQPTGFTIATINPLYVCGNYNCPNPTHLGTTNTTQTFPASLVADALTVLSSNWQDSTYGNAAHATYGTTGLANRNASAVTINAAIIAGAVYSTGTAAGQWSGGAQNLPRLLEDWAGITLTLNTSLVNLYDSVRANTQFQNPGNYYNAPVRSINFDQNFNNSAKLPPGTPVLVDVAPAN